MKNIFLYTLTLLLFCSFLTEKRAHAVRERNGRMTGGPGIVMKITPKEKGEPVPNVFIRLYHDTSFVHEYQTTKPDGWLDNPQTVTVQLETDSKYSVSFSAKGYLKFVVMIDTHLPPGMNLSAPLQAVADVNMLKESEHPDLKDADFPLVLLKYDKEKGMFMPSKEYAKSIKIMMQMK